MKHHYFVQNRTRLALAITLAYIFVAALSPVASFAASDGSIGTTSTGTSTVSVTVPELVRITGIANISLGTWNGSSNLDGNDDVCIYTNKSGGTYYVTATGSGTSNAFTIADGSNTLAYTVYFNDATGTTGEVQLTSGTKSAAQSGANTSSQTCGGSNNANFHVNIASAALSAVPAGSYSGTLTLLIEPN